MTSALRDLLRRLPKTDLHCHLDGSVRPATALALARELGVKLPADNAADLKRFVTVAPTCRSLKEFLDVFDLLYPLLRSPGSVERIAYELIEDCAAENIRHVEVRFAPSLQEAPGFDADAVVEAALKGLERGRRDFGTTSSVIVCLFRSHGPAQNRRSFETLKKFFRAGTGETPSVVGLDLAGDEARYPTKDYASFYEEAKSLGIYTTCHAGETTGTKNLEAALELGVMRIGHGIRLLEAPELLKEAVRRRIPVEIGITSNVMTKTVPDLRSHPALSFHRAGLPVTLNTDDRGIIGIDLTHEYEQAHALGFTLPELTSLAAASVDHLFMPRPRRDALKRRFAAEIEALTAAADGGTRR